MEYYFGNQYEYFSEEIDDKFPETLIDKLYTHVFLDMTTIGMTRSLGDLSPGCFQ